MDFHQHQRSVASYGVRKHNANDAKFPIMEIANRDQARFLVPRDAICH